MLRLRLTVLTARNALRNSFAKTDFSSFRTQISRLQYVTFYPLHQLNIA